MGDGGERRAPRTGAADGPPTPGAVLAAEEAGTDAARLEAYETVRQIVEWLNIPLDRPEVYP